MRRYSISYDAKDSEVYDLVDLKLNLTRLLIEKGATNLQNPVASTLIFEDNIDSNRITIWERIIEEDFGELIHYYLCLVAKTNDGEHVDRIKWDPEMMSNYRILLRNF